MKTVWLLMAYTPKHLTPYVVSVYPNYQAATNYLASVGAKLDTERIGTWKLRDYYYFLEEWPVED